MLCCFLFSLNALRQFLQLDSENKGKVQLSKKSIFLAKLFSMEIVKRAYVKHSQAFNKKESLEAMSNFIFVKLFACTYTFCTVLYIAFQIKVAPH